MRNKMKVIERIFVLVLAGGILSAEAGSVKVKAKGSVPYGLRAGKSARREAVEDAKKNAVRNYASKWDSARYEMFDKAFIQVEDNIDQYVLSYVLLDSGKNKTTKQYEAYIEATLNDNAIERLVRETASSMASGSGGEAPYITMIMVGREPETQKRFKTKKTDIAQSTHSGSSEENVTGNSADFYEEETARVTSGGSSERKADQIKYRTFTVTDVDAAISEVFTKAGYEVVDPRDVELEVSYFQMEYSAGANITASSRRDAIRQCREMEIAFFAIGNMDVSLPEYDEVSGMDKVYVKVSVKVTDLRKRLPKTVASIRGVQYAGLGSNPEVARQNALNMAAEKSAKDLIDQLRAKRVLAN